MSWERPPSPAPTASNRQPHVAPRHLSDHAGLSRVPPRRAGSRRPTGMAAISRWVPVPVARHGTIRPQPGCTAFDCAASGLRRSAHRPVVAPPGRGWLAPIGGCRHDAKRDRRSGRTFKITGAGQANRLGSHHGRFAGVPLFHGMLQLPPDNRPPGYLQYRHTTECGHNQEHGFHETFLSAVRLEGVTFAPTSQPQPCPPTFQSKPRGPARYRERTSGHIPGSAGIRPWR